MSNILLLLQRVHQNVHQNRHSLDKKNFLYQKFTPVVWISLYGMNFQKKSKNKHFLKVSISIINL